MMHIAENQDALLDYLYEEGDPAARLKVATHLQECAECAVAVLEMQNVRGLLSDWTPPAAQLGFRIVRDGDTSPRDTSPSASVGHRARGGWSWGWGPTTNQERSWGWAQAAAAVLIFAAGMAVSQLRVEYGGGVLTVRAGQASPAVSARANSIELAPPLPQNVDIEEVTRRVSEQLAARNTSPDEAERVLQRVRAMIDQSEQRQQRELALRLSQVASEVDTQHQADLMRMQQTVGQTQEFVDYLVRTSGGVK